MAAGNANKTQVERASDRELVIRRTFRAQPATVYDAMTKPELLKRWWAPRSLGVELFEVTADIRVGGTYRYVFGRPGSPPMAFSGVYRELVPAARSVYTQVFEPMREAGEAVVTATFEAVAAGTLLVVHELYPSKEVLDGALATGMEKGMFESYDQLDALVSELDPART